MTESMMDCRLPRHDTDPMRGIARIIDTLRQDQDRQPRPYAVALVEAHDRRAKEQEQ